MRLVEYQPCRHCGVTVLHRDTEWGDWCSVASNDLLQGPSQVYTVVHRAWRCAVCSWHCTRRSVCFAVVLCRCALQMCLGGMLYRNQECSVSHESAQWHAVMMRQPSPELRCCGWPRGVIQLTAFTSMHSPLCILHTSGQFWPTRLVGRR